MIPPTWTPKKLPFSGLLQGNHNNLEPQRPRKPEAFLQPGALTCKTALFFGNCQGSGGGHRSLGGLTHKKEAFLGCAMVLLGSTGFCRVLRGF